MSKGLTKKEINRFSKAQLIKIIIDEGLPCNKRDSKRQMVECVFKNKNLRKSLTAPPKRKMSEKQLANLKRFRLGSNFKNEEKIKKPAQLDAEERKLTTGIIATPASVQPKTKVIPSSLKEEKAPVSNTELKAVIKKVEAKPKLVRAEKPSGKLGKFSVGQKDYKYEKVVKSNAQYDADLKKVEDIVAPHRALVSNNKEISKDLQEKIDLEDNFIMIDRISNMKVSDEVALNIMGDHQKQNKRDFIKAVNQAKGEREGGDLEEAEEEPEHLRDDQKEDLEELIRLAKLRRAGAGEDGGVTDDEEDFEILDSDEEESEDFRENEEEKAEEEEITDEDRDFLTMTTDIINWEQIVRGLSAEERKRQFDDEEKERKNKLFIESMLHRAVNKGFINPRDGRFVRFDSKEFQTIFNSFRNNLRPRELEMINDFISRELGDKKKQQRAKLDKKAQDKADIQADKRKRDADKKKKPKKKETKAEQRKRLDKQVGNKKKKGGKRGKEGGGLADSPIL